MRPTAENFLFSDIRPLPKPDLLMPFKMSLQGRVIYKNCLVYICEMQSTQVVVF